MKRYFKHVLAAVLLAAFLFPLDTRAAVSVYLRIGPPPVKRVRIVRPKRPYAHCVWVSGHWQYRHGHYVWVNGHWIKHRPGFVYIQPHWKKTDRGYYFVPGHWVRARR
ncbi:MAG: hypothetical protein D6743_18380 [Calditrichaeota bacterium]|nr:MAG: hypothetical protein D6743_18380 [Calditrichota bacterium]